MLVTFKSDAYADIMMFGDAAHRLLKMMGHSGTVPSAILADDVPAALERLKRAIEEGKSRSQEPSSDPGGVDPDDQTISLNYRAIPLIELLTAAAKKHCDVMWDKV
ncbi:DUF1840 domain-containing protein [Nitrosospira briensis]|uniref:DUF1840 domain-containing protein n=1 Tax=Nitrosospira briensis TaxID=35799 RepID=UPI000468A2D6|nr:DUF1840 domain-containing protein [Nitrosospira briensis]